MSLVLDTFNQRQNNYLARLPELANTAYSLGQVAANIYKNLPDTRKDKNSFKSSFERKLMPRNTATIDGNRGVRSRLVDSSSAASTPGQEMRSFTGSHAIARSNRKRSGKAKIPRSPYLDSISVCFRGSLTLVNTAINTHATNISLGHSTPIGSNNLNGVVPQMSAMAGIFREFRLKKLQLEFVPRLGSNAAGQVAVCVDRDPRAAVPASSTGVIRKDPFFECDVKQNAMLLWEPVTIEDKRWRYTVDATRPQEFQSCGMWLTYSTNDQISGANIGEIFVDVWVDYAVPF